MLNTNLQNALYSDLFLLNKIIIIIMQRATRGLTNTLAGLKLSDFQKSQILQLYLRLQKKNFYNYAISVKVLGERIKLESWQITKITREVYLAKQAMHKRLETMTRHIGNFITWQNPFSLQITDMLLRKANFRFYTGKQWSEKLKYAITFQKICLIHWKIVMGELNMDNTYLQLCQICKQLEVTITSEFYTRISDLVNTRDIEFIKAQFLQNTFFTQTWNQLKREAEMLKIQIIALSQLQQSQSKVDNIPSQIKFLENTLSRSDRMVTVSNSIYSQFKKARQINISVKKDAVIFIIFLYLSRLGRVCQMFLQLLTIPSYSTAAVAIYMQSANIQKIYGLYYYRIDKEQSQGPIKTPTIMEKELAKQIQAVSAESKVILQQQKYNIQFIQEYGSTGQIISKMKSYFFKNQIRNLNMREQFFHQILTKNEQLLQQIKKKGQQHKKNLLQSLQTGLRFLKGTSYRYMLNVDSVDRPILDQSWLKTLRFFTFSNSQLYDYLKPTHFFGKYSELMFMRNMISSREYDENIGQSQIIKKTKGEDNLSTLRSTIVIPLGPLQKYDNKTRILSFIKNRIQILDAQVQAQSDLQNMTFMASQSLELHNLANRVVFECPQKMSEEQKNKYVKQLSSILELASNIYDSRTDRWKLIHYLTKYELTFPVSLQLVWQLMVNPKQFSQELQFISSDVNGFAQRIRTLEQIYQQQQKEGMLQCLLIILVLIHNKNNTKPDLANKINNVQNKIKQKYSSDFYQVFVGFYKINKSENIALKNDLIMLARKFTDESLNSLFSERIEYKDNQQFVKKESILNAISNVEQVLFQDTGFQQIQARNTFIQLLAIQNQTEQILQDKRAVGNKRNQIVRTTQKIKALGQQRNATIAKMNDLKHQIDKIIGDSQLKWTISIHKITPSLDKTSQLFKITKRYDSVQVANDRFLMPQEKRKLLSQIFAQKEKLTSVIQIQSYRNWLETKQKSFYISKAPAQYQTMKKWASNKLQSLRIIIQAKDNEIKFLKNICRDLEMQIRRLKHKRNQLSDQSAVIEGRLKKQSIKGPIIPPRQQVAYEQHVQDSLKKGRQQVEQYNKQKRIDSKKKKKQRAIHIQTQKSRIQQIQSLLQLYKKFFDLLMSELMVMNEKIRTQFNALKDGTKRKVVKIVLQMNILLSQIYLSAQKMSQVHIETFTPKVGLLIASYTIEMKK